MKRLIIPIFILKRPRSSLLGIFIMTSIQRAKNFYLLCWLIGISIISACQNNDIIVTSEDSEEFQDTTLVSIKELVNPELTIQERIISQKADTFRVMRDGQTVAIVRLGNPIIVAQSEKWETWGYFQFPKIYRCENGYLIVEWQNDEDSYTSYGKDNYRRLMSKDEGKTWEPLDREYFHKEPRRVEYDNGDVLQVKDPVAKDINIYPEFPKPVNNQRIDRYDFYLESEVPKELQGAYLELWSRQENKTTIIHSTINDPGLLRYTVDGQMPIVFWGDLKLLPNGDLIAGITGGYYQNSEGVVQKAPVSFYKSSNSGRHWDILGKIQYQKEGNENCPFDGSEGFEEPTFEILRDGSFLCVMRNGSSSPMYRAFSYSDGTQWTTPEPFTPNGVMPSLKLLDNGILVLTSGRPGVQIRFSLDGDGKKWTEPIDMLPFVDEKGNLDTWVTCGYCRIMSTDDHSFYMVYSDFRCKNINGEYIKTILFRKVEVNKRG